MSKFIELKCPVCGETIRDDLDEFNNNLFKGIIRECSCGGVYSVVRTSNGFDAHKEPTRIKRNYL